MTPVQSNITCYSIFSLNTSVLAYSNLNALTLRHKAPTHPEAKLYTRVLHVSQQDSRAHQVYNLRGLCWSASQSRTVYHYNGAFDCVQLATKDILSARSCALQIARLVKLASIVFNGSNRVELMYFYKSTNGDIVRYFCLVM